MPELSYSREVAALVADVWSFVADMDAWAPFLSGYQRHTKLSETESIWFLKGEIGGLTRTVEFRVRLRDWNVGTCISFDLEGVNDPMSGSGMFTARSLESLDEKAEEPEVRLGFAQRLVRWISRHVVGTILGQRMDEERPSGGHAVAAEIGDDVPARAHSARRDGTAAQHAARADAAAGGGGSRIADRNQSRAAGRMIEKVR